MSTAMLLPFLAFAFVASATPGPNNVMLLATAATHGLRATLPLVLGVAFGFGFMVAMVGIGLAAPLARFPLLHTTLRWVGVCWMLVLAWQIARAGTPSTAGRKPRAAPLGFWKTCAFQWVNPKAWIMAMATAATYTVPGGDLRLQVIALAGLFVLVSLPVAGSWAVLGAGTSRFLASPTRLKRFNLIMGLLLAASVIPVIME